MSEEAQEAQEAQEEQSRRHFAFWRDLEDLLSFHDIHRMVGVPKQFLTVYLLNCLSSLQSMLEAKDKGWPGSDAT